MPLRTCCFCEKQSNNLVRFSDGGIKYKCDTKECDDFITQKELDAQKEEKQQRKDDQEKWDQKCREANGEYVKVNRKNFIKASKQQRDCHTRWVDPLKQVIFKNRLHTDVWEETNELLSDIDVTNIIEFMDGHYLNDPE